MKIDRIDVNAYQAKHRKPYSNGKYTYSTTDIVICRVFTDDGFEGIGWAHGTDVVVDTMLSLRERSITARPAMISIHLHQASTLHSSDPLAITAASSVLVQEDGSMSI